MVQAAPRCELLLTNSRIPTVDILCNRITTYKLTLWQNLSHPDIIVELLWRSQKPQIQGRKSYSSTAPFPHCSFKGVFMKPLHNPFDFNKSSLEFDNLLSQRVNDGNMRKAPWKDFYLQIMVNPRWPILSFSLSCHFSYCCYFQRHFIVSLKSPGWRQRAALQTLWGSKNDCW